MSPTRSLPTTPHVPGNHHARPSTDTNQPRSTTKAGTRPHRDSVPITTVETSAALRWHTGAS